MVALASFRSSSLSFAVVATACQLVGDVGADGLRHKRLSLSYYDSAGFGFLREPDLEAFIADQMTVFPCLQVLEESFTPFYQCTAVRKLFFFLDPQRKGKIKIKDLATCTMLDDFFALRHANLPEAELASNWFSSHNALRVYSMYLRLDMDRNGLLSREELQHFGGRGLTSVFVERVFQQCHTYDDEIDYKTFLDFVLAMENKQTPQSLRFFWRFLDVQNKGFLSIFDINYFFREVAMQLERSGHPVVEVVDVKDEIFDMVKPADPLKITLEDLEKSNVGGTVISMLIDMQAFYEYDNRESFLAQDDDDEGTL
mmetsp:Transcript_42560/g.100151  ORF Transcript_42560/g.100151 Transcript_42560/m.100151 type:complete len:313 (+) Transcript_42560:319-1257(+)